jgi:hypothetical protein
MRSGIILVMACGASQHGGADDRGDAARILCEAECHHDARCGNPPDCGRCATLPVRTPPVWSAGWAREVGACMEAAACSHDADEACVFATSRRTRAAVACVDAHDRLCPVLQGLTPAADARVTACYQAGRDDCMPPMDWK